MAHFDRVAARARRAYELGRLLGSLRFAAPFGLALSFGALQVGSAQAAALALLGFAVIAGGRWWGRGPGRGVRTGALAGLFPLLCPLLLISIGNDCAGCAPRIPMPVCLAACVASGAIAGLWSWSRDRLSGGSVETVAALATAALMGAVGCGVAGGFGLLGLAIGMALGGLPAVVRLARS